MDVDAPESSHSLRELPRIAWNYDMRRKKQEILPNIFLGPYQCATKSQLENLVNDGITHILCVRQDVEARCVKINFPDKFLYKVIEFRDHPCESIISRFPEARDFINQCLTSGGKILIHGVNGMSRSAALLIAFIMESWSLSFDDALQLVKRRRYCVDVNYGFRNQLKAYEPIYKARNMCNEWDDGECSRSFSMKRKAEEDIFSPDLNQNFKKP